MSEPAGGREARQGRCGWGLQGGWHRLHGHKSKACIRKQLPCPLLPPWNIIARILITANSAERCSSWHSADFVSFTCLHLMAVSPMHERDYLHFFLGTKVICELEGEQQTGSLVIRGSIYFFRFIAGSSLQSFSKRNRLKSSSALTLMQSVVVFLPLASPLSQVHVVSSMSNIASVWLVRRTYTRVGLIWSKLCTSGWVVVLWPCLCWMSAPCLSWEQPTGIPQIWHTALHAHRENRGGEIKK